MTKPMMDLRAHVEQSADADVLREMIGFVAERLMELEVGAKTGADYGEKSTDRLAQRNRGSRRRHGRHPDPQERTPLEGGLPCCPRPQRHPAGEQTLWPDELEALGWL